MELPSLSRCVVVDKILVYQEESREITVPVGVPAWYDWLERARSFSFRSDEGTFTAHKARPGNQRGNGYWYAYLRRHGQLFRLYLGASSTLTSERLDDAARQLSLKAETSARQPPEVSVPEEDRSTTLFLTTKFHIPRLPIHYIARSRLLAELDQGAQTRLTLVTAPAGSGKTTLLAAWARTTNLPVAWLSLEAADDDPARFLSALVAAINHADRQIEIQERGFQQMAQEHSREDVLIRFTNDLATLLVRDIVVILDDYHLITSEPIHATLRFLLEHAPSQLHLIIGTRSDPPLPLARLRVRDQLHELDTGALGFIANEIEAFVRAMGLTLSTEAISLLEQRAEGWVAGVQLLALALRGRTDATAFLRTASGTHRFLLDYVSEEILAQQSVEMQRFLLRTSVLEQITGPLCDAVTGEMGGKEKLAALRKANLFVSELDDVNTWYRYHPLFAEALRAHLQKMEPELIPELYQRASYWYEQHQREEEACDYAMLAGDFPRAAHLIAEFLPRLVEQGRIERLYHWLNQLPPDLIAASPQLYITTPWLYSISTHSPGEVGAALKRMERHVQKQQQDTKESWVEPQSVLTLFHAITELSQNHLPQALILVHKALRVLTSSETALGQLLSRFLQISLSIIYGANGDLATAEQILLDLSHTQSSGFSSLVHLAASFLLGELYRVQGKLRKDEVHYADFLQTFEAQRAIPPMPLLVLSFSLLRKASLYYEWNRLSEAADDIKQVLEMFARAVPAIIPHDSRPHLFLFGLWAQARIEWAQGRPEAAYHFLELVRSQSEMLKRPLPGKDRPPVSVPVLIAHLALLCERLEDALYWSDAFEIDPVDVPATLLNSRQIFTYLTLARILIAQGRSLHSEEPLSQALHLLRHWQQLAERLDFRGWLIEIQMLTALALQAQGNTRQALTLLGEVLAQAEPEGYVRLFVDAGRPMAHLLAQVSDHTSASPAYLQRLQHTFPPPPPALIGAARPAQTQLDPLSGREHEVLVLLAAGISNQQIAEQLVISPHTAKRHVKNILAKLSATNRTQAVARARELHLL